MKKNIFSSSIAGASFTLAFFSLFSKGIGFFREIIYANNFGLSSDYDLFLSSTGLVIIIQIVFLYFTQHYFIPTYNKLRMEGENKGEEFLNYTFWWSIIIGIILSLFLLIISKHILSVYLSGLNETRMNSALLFFWILLISIPFNNGISVLSAYLQAKFLFVYPAVSQIVINVIIIVIVFFFAGNTKIIILPVSIVIAYSIGFVFLLKSTPNIRFNWREVFRYKLAFIEKSNLFNLFIIELVSLSYILVDRYFIDDVPVGSLSAMNFALVLFSLPVSVFSLPLVTALFSKFSRDNVENPSSLENNYNISMKVNNFVIVLIASVMFIWGDVFLKLFYEGGAFTSQSTAITHEVLKYYIIGLLFYSGYLIQVKLFYSLNKYKFIMWLSVVAFFIKIIFNIILVDNYKQNGLAFSTSIVYIFLFFGAYFILKKIYFGKSKFSVFIFSVYYVFNALVALFTSFAIVNVLIGKDSTIKSILEIILFSLVYLFNIYLMKGEEIEKISFPILKYFRLRFAR